MALRLFICQGYHVAREAGISIGNIYNYYPTKEALYVSLVKPYRMAKAQADLKPLLGKFDAESLRALAKAGRGIVYEKSQLLAADTSTSPNLAIAISRIASDSCPKLSPNWRRLPACGPVSIRRSPTRRFICNSLLTFWWGNGSPASSAWASRKPLPSNN